MSHCLCDKCGAVYNIHPCDAAEIDEAESRVARLEAEVGRFAALCNENGVRVELLTEALRKIMDGPVCPCGAEQARDVARRALEEKL